jgi:hypothetical protein
MHLAIHEFLVKEETLQNLNRNYIYKVSTLSGNQLNLNQTIFLFDKNQNGIKNCRSVDFILVSLNLRSIRKIDGSSLFQKVNRQNKKLPSNKLI